VTRPSAEALELSRARSGNEAAFERLVDPHRSELQVHCYRILGSFQDAEDMVQETLVAAWRGLETFEGRSSLRTWLYRIATNACLGVLRRTRPAREIPPPPEPPGDYPPASRTTAEPIWLEPYPDAWIDDLPGSVPGPEARYDSREAIELAFVVALQQLAPRERAAVVLKDVLGFRAAETADLLDTTESAVNSALQRARDKLDRLSRDRRALEAPRPGSRRERDLVSRFAGAFESGDVGAVVALLSEDARLTMPPEPMEYVGRPEIHAARSRGAPQAADSHPADRSSRPVSARARAPRPARSGTRTAPGPHAHAAGPAASQLGHAASFLRSIDELQCRCILPAT
jgi:RNA polymerase sigma-70 factor, ECF subfamily